jgi:uncharacterized protein DUF397
VTEYRITSHDQDGRVEIERLPDGGVAIRAGGAPPHGPVLTFTREEWVAFAAGVKNGEFDTEQAWQATATSSSDR